jgi:GxxExxY protein
MKRRGAEDAEGLHNAISQRVIGAAIEVHRSLGPGLLESVYAACLAREFQLLEIEFDQERPIPVAYKGIKVDNGYRVDFVIERQVILELKAAERLHPIHLAQLLTYLRLTDTRLGLLINFNVPVLREGVRRVVNNL